MIVMTSKFTDGLIVCSTAGLDDKKEYIKAHWPNGNEVYQGILKVQ